MTRKPLYKRPMDFALCLLTGASFVAALCWAMLNGYVSRQGIHRWGELAISTAILISLSLPLRKRTARRSRFWLVYTALFALRILLLGWFLWTYDDTPTLIHAFLLPAELAWMTFILGKCCPPNQPHKPPPHPTWRSTQL